MSWLTKEAFFMWEDTGKELTRELINFKFRVHKIIPAELREKVFSELDNAVDTALKMALNFDQLEEYYKWNKVYTDNFKEDMAQENK